MSPTERYIRDMLDKCDARVKELDSQRAELVVALAAARRTPARQVELLRARLADEMKLRARAELRATQAERRLTALLNPEPQQGVFWASKTAEEVGD